MRPVDVPFLRLREVTKVYNAGQADEIAVLEGISLDIARGSMVALKGPSGSGKTTLLSLLGCMSRPSSGSIEIEGRDIARLPERFLAEFRRSRYGFIFQQFNLIRDLSVIENVLLPLYPGPIPFSEMAARAERVLGEMQIGHRKRLPVRKLSGGEQQRVAIARALITEPEIVIADEPTAHLDPDLSREMMETLSRLRQGGTTVLLATHDPLVYGHGAVDAVVAMRSGRVLDGSSP